MIFLEIKTSVLQIQIITVRPKKLIVVLIIAAVALTVGVAR